MNQTTVSRNESFYVPSLDGFRALAVLIVFFSHTGAPQLVPGGFGVTIFFFLSGYLITTLLRLEEERTGTVSLGQFYLRRVLRILPPMYIALAFAIALTTYAGATFSWATIGLQALQFSNYHVALGGTGRPFGTSVLWSLSVEEHFYLLFPLAYRLVGRVFPRVESRALVFFLACMALLAWRCVSVIGLGLSPEYVMHATETRVDSILLGCAFALWRNPALPGPEISATWLRVATPIAIVVELATIVYREPTFRETWRYTIQGLAMVPIFAAAIRFPEFLPFQVLNLRLVRRIGVLSYSFYLVHLPIIETLRHTVTWSEWRIAMVSLVASLMLSEAMYRAVERPCARLRKKLSAARESLPSSNRPAVRSGGERAA